MKRRVPNHTKTHDVLQPFTPALPGGRGASGARGAGAWRLGSQWAFVIAGKR